MTAHQMVCHLADAYLGGIGDRPMSPRRLSIPRPLLKWLMLNMPWPKGAPTPRETDQDIGGTRPTEFGADRARLVDALDRFCSAPGAMRGPHPLVGPITPEDWMRWGYRHADHHLRQFGV